jgi:hypothetical protein
MNPTTALRAAKASEVTYYIDHPNGITACPFYNDVGFTGAGPVTFLNGIDGALVGVTATEILVAFRGTLPFEKTDWNGFVEILHDWANDADASLRPVSYSTGFVHTGFAKSLDALWTSVLAAVAAQTATGLPIIVTGHSKGGALATLAALRLFKNGITPSEVYTFGSPRTGNTAFANDYEANITQHWRFEHSDDIVPHVPPSATVLRFIETFDPRLTDLSAHGYDPVGLLEFINWSSQVNEGDSLFLDSDRLLHFGKLTFTGQIKQVFEDHKLESQYIPNMP